MYTHKDSLINVTTKWSNYITIFLLIYLSSSFYGLSIKGSINAAILLIVTLVTFTINPKSKKIKLNTLFFVLFIILSSSMTMIIKSDEIYNYSIFWVFLICAYIVYISIDINEFIIIFNKIIYFLCVFSLVTFIALMLYPSVFDYFPSITNVTGLTMKNAFFSVVYNSSYFNSNFGLFWEPGAFQYFINLALYLQLFIIKTLDKKRVLVFLITIATTFSTTGYISTLFILFIFIFYTKTSIKEEFKNKKKMILIIFTFIVVGFFIFNSLPSHITFKVFGKLEAILNPELANINPSYISTAARTSSLKIPLQGFLKSPFWGEGFTALSRRSLEMGSGFLTATPLNWFGLFGLPLGVMLNICVWRWSKAVDGNLLLKLLIFAFLIISVISENFNRNSFYLVFLLYSFDLNLLKNRNGIS